MAVVLVVIHHMRFALANSHNFQSQSAPKIDLAGVWGQHGGPMAPTWVHKPSWERKVRFAGPFLAPKLGPKNHLYVTRNGHEGFCVPLGAIFQGANK